MMQKQLQKVMIFYVIVKRLLTDEENVVNVGNFFQGLLPDLLLLDTHDPSPIWYGRVGVTKAQNLVPTGIPCLRLAQLPSSAK